MDSASNKEKEIKTIITNPLNNYLTELILGAHWKYHTELCLYDGDRPPFHDPVLVIANKILFPYSLFNEGMTWYENKDLYKHIYPEMPTKFDCHCSDKDRLFGVSEFF